MVVVSYVGDNICRMGQMDKINVYFQESYYKKWRDAIGLRGRLEKMVKYVVKHSCLCVGMRFRESV